MLAQKRVLVTDTTMRDAHQSLLATRMRGYDIARIADSYARGLPGLLSLECWGGAAFDVSMRFLSEDPWEVLAKIREAVPNILTQTLVRGANGVGYANYPDNVVRFFIRQAAEAGMDIFRVFDCLNWIENMRVSIDEALKTGKLVEGAICYAGDLIDPARSKYDLKYYVSMAKELEKTGIHVLGLKDMGGLVKPAAARVLFKALKEEIGLPIHFHTHDTSGVSGASVLAAVEAGVDAVDLAMDAMSGMTSQPCLGSIVEALRGSERDTGLDPEAIRRISFYWEGVRAQYAAFESDLKGPASEVYLHEMPGGQFTNLKEQARSMGLESRWHEVAEGLSRRQRPVRRHHQGHAFLQGGGRPRADDGEPGPLGRRRARPQARRRLPGLGGGDAARRVRPAAGRMAGSPAEEGAEGRAADHRALRLADRGCRPRGRAAPRRRSSSAARRMTASSPPTSCTRRCSPTSHPWWRSSARSRRCRPRCSSTA